MNSTIWAIYFSTFVFNFIILEKKENHSAYKSDKFMGKNSYSIFSVAEIDNI